MLSWMHYVQSYHFNVTTMHHNITPTWYSYMQTILIKLHNHLLQIVFAFPVVGLEFISDSLHLCSVFILGLLGGAPPPPPKSHTHPIRLRVAYTTSVFFYQNCSQINLRTNNMLNFLSQLQNSPLMAFYLLFYSSWAGQLRIVDCSVVTPYIPDLTPKE